MSTFRELQRCGISLEYFNEFGSDGIPKRCGIEREQRWIDERMMSLHQMIVVTMELTQRMFNALNCQASIGARRICSCVDWFKSLEGRSLNTILVPFVQKQMRPRTNSDDKRQALRLLRFLQKKGYIPKGNLLSHYCLKNLNYLRRLLNLRLRKENMNLTLKIG